MMLLVAWVYRIVMKTSLPEMVDCEETGREVARVLSETSPATDQWMVRHMTPRMAWKRYYMWMWKAGALTPPVPQYVPTLPKPPLPRPPNGGIHTVKWSCPGCGAQLNSAAIRAQHITAAHFWD